MIFGKYFVITANKLTTFFYRLIGCPPFWHRKQMIMLRNIMEGRYSFTSPEWDDITGIFNDNLQKNFLTFLNPNVFGCILDAPKDLISKLLVVDPKRRFTVDEALKHEFFQVLVSYMPCMLFVELCNPAVLFKCFSPPTSTD